MAPLSPPAAAAAATLPLLFQLPSNRRGPPLILAILVMIVAILSNQLFFCLSAGTWPLAGKLSESEAATSR